MALIGNDPPSRLCTQGLSRMRPRMNAPMQPSQMPMHDEAMATTIPNTGPYVLSKMMLAAMNIGVGGKVVAVSTATHSARRGMTIHPR
eukprot:9494269-Pyramimonas_sp.AAC.1